MHISRNQAKTPYVLIPFPLVLALLCLLGAGIILFTAHDCFLYNGKTAVKIVDAWLSESFLGQHHTKRIEMLDEM